MLTPSCEPTTTADAPFHVIDSVSVVVMVVSTGVSVPEPLLPPLSGGFTSLHAAITNTKLATAISLIVKSIRF